MCVFSMWSYVITMDLSGPLNVLVSQWKELNHRCLLSAFPVRYERSKCWLTKREQHMNDRVCFCLELLGNSSGGFLRYYFSIVLQKSFSRLISFRKYRFPQHLPSLNLRVFCVWLTHVILKTRISCSLPNFCLSGKYTADCFTVCH